ncbi:MAG: type II toxin-antitoxin system VapC family toxin [Chloroflexi bacterium]|nr:type II toxin-antitoxin system VapC family toxin [Chloroflexota bacterium]
MVVDASVAVKWVLTTEELSDNAQALLEQNLRSHRPILAPAHLPSEVTSALYQCTRTREPRRHITEDEAQEALSRFLEYPIELITTPELYQRAFLFGRTHGLLNIYDILYVVAAQMANSELWTADRRLFDAIGPTAPWVRWIGDYPPV